MCPTPPPAVSSDGTRLHYEEYGSGTPILFLHEFAGDHRSWYPQVSDLRYQYRCIVFAARGYRPSDVPADPASYSQDLAVEDARAVLRAADVERAHLVGLSMGGFTALQLALEHPALSLSAVVAGSGYGAQRGHQAGFRAEVLDTAEQFIADPRRTAERYASGPTRVQFMDKAPERWREFADLLAEHDPVGTANTLIGVQASRTSLFELEDRLRGMTTPVLVVTGDEDDGCLETNLMLKRAIPTAGWAVLPRTGHTLNLEEPEVFNAMVGRFIAQVDAGDWSPRNPLSMGRGLIGMSGRA